MSVILTVLAAAAAVPVLVTFNVNESPEVTLSPGTNRPLCVFNTARFGSCVIFTLCVMLVVLEAPPPEMPAVNFWGLLALDATFTVTVNAGKLLPVDTEVELVQLRLVQLQPEPFG